MIEYLCLLFVVFCIGGQFSLTKLYQTQVKNGTTTSLLFSLISGLFATIIFACICNFNISFNWFSFLMAAGGTLCIVLYTVIGMKMMSIGRVAVYTMIIMLGGMFLPFLYGVTFLNEQISVWKILGVVFLVIALIMPIMEKSDEKIKNPKLFIVLSVIVFIANGMVGVFNKVHQISQNAISTLEFGFWQNVISCSVLCIVVAVMTITNKDKPTQKKQIKLAFSKWYLILIFTLVSQGGGVLQLFVAKTVDASVMFPIVTGGTMVVSTAFGKLFFKEKIDKFLIIGLVMAIISTVAFIL